MKKLILILSFVFAYSSYGMELSNIPEEAFNFTEFRNAYLKHKDFLEIPTSQANNIDRELWEDVFSLVNDGIKITDARIYSPELLWANIVGMNVPAGWPDRIWTDGEGVETVKKIWEYTYVLRSEVDTTKCMMKYAKFSTYNGTSGGKYVPPYGYSALSHDQLKAYYVEFGGFSSYNEAKAWKDANIIAE